MRPRALRGHGTRFVRDRPERRLRRDRYPRNRKLGNGGRYSEPHCEETLIADDDGQITLYAQWNPWPYHIAYDANGGEGHIPTQDFVYEKDPADPWNSETNNDRFTRKGYKFIGFKYQNEEGEWSDLIPPTGVEDFYDYLVNVLKVKDSTVTLYAQWQKNPVKPYALPTTGIDRR